MRLLPFLYHDIAGAGRWQEERQPSADSPPADGRAAISNDGPIAQVAQQVMTFLGWL
jgi:hypothetical protein